MQFVNARVPTYRRKRNSDGKATTKLKRPGTGDNTISKRCFVLATTAEDHESRTGWDGWTCIVGPRLRYRYLALPWLFPGCSPPRVPRLWSEHWVSLRASLPIKMAASATDPTVFPPSHSFCLSIWSSHICSINSRFFPSILPSLSPLTPPVTELLASRVGLQTYASLRKHHRLICFSSSWTTTLLQAKTQNTLNLGLASCT